MADVIRDPRLLPWRMTAEEVASLCNVSLRTVRRYCANGIWRRDVHWVMHRGTNQRRFIREAIIQWMSGAAPTVDRPAIKGKFNPRLSPALAALAEREAS